MSVCQKQRNMNKKMNTFPYIASALLCIINCVFCFNANASTRNYLFNDQWRFVRDSIQGAQSPSLMTAIGSQSTCHTISAWWHCQAATTTNRWERSRNTRPVATIRVTWWRHRLVSQNHSSWMPPTEARDSSWFRWCVHGNGCLGER